MVTNPTPNPDVPAELAAATEAAQNRVTLLQAEARRLQSLAESIERDISSLVAGKADLEAEFPLLSARNVKAEESAAAAEYRRDSAEKEAKRLHRESEELAARIGAVTDELRERESALVARENDLDAKAASVAAQERSLADERDALDARIARIGAAIA